MKEEEKIQKEGEAPKEQDVEFTSESLFREIIDTNGKVAELSEKVDMLLINLAVKDVFEKVFDDLSEGEDEEEETPCNCHKLPQSMPPLRYADAEPSMVAELYQDMQERKQLRTQAAEAVTGIILTGLFGFTCVLLGASLYQRFPKWFK